MLPARSESPGDILVSRDDLRREAMGVVGCMQALEGFLRDRDDLSRERLADMMERDWRRLNDAAEKVPPLNPAGDRGEPWHDAS